MRFAADSGPGANEFPCVRAELSGRGARGNLAEDGREIRVHRLDPNYANRIGRCRQRCRVIEINGYRVREMADAAVVILVGLCVPVPGRLESERHHQESHHRGDDATGDFRLRVQLKELPQEMVIRRSGKGNRCQEFAVE